MSYSLGIAALEVRQRAVELADPAVRQMAEDAVNQGNTAFRAGDYDTAIRRYTDAWTIYPAQNVLLLIGVTMMRQGRYQDAAYRFARYLRECPGCDQTRLAQEQLANAQAAIERASGSGPVDMDFVAEGQPPAVAPAPVPPQVLAQARQTVQAPAQAAQLAPPPTSIRNPYRETPSYLPWIVGGVATLGVAGFAFWLTRRERKAAVTANRRRRRRGRR